MTTDTPSPSTLAQHLAGNRISTPEALSYAASLAETLRKMHEEGLVHGAVAPEHIALTGSGPELLPPVASFTVTPYMAPEVLAGKPADAQSDIFSLGAVIYEMLTGRRAFEGESAAALASAINGATPPPTGMPGVDGFLANCMAKDRSVRLQRMRRVVLELKLLGAIVRRDEAPPSTRRDTEFAALRSGAREMEARFTARLDAQEAAAAEAARATGDAINGLRGDLSGLSGELAGLRGELTGLRGDLAGIGSGLGDLRGDLTGLRGDFTGMQSEIGAVRGDFTGMRGDVNGLRGEVNAVSEIAALAERSAGAVEERVAARMEQTLGATAQRLARAEQILESVNQQLALHIQGCDAMRNQSAAFQQNATADLQNLGRGLKAQDAVIESLRSDSVQADNLVERLVEALELLQATVFDNRRD
jgi:hypothetical protein